MGRVLITISDEPRAQAVATALRERCTVSFDVYPDEGSGGWTIYTRDKMSPQMFSELHEYAEGYSNALRSASNRQALCLCAELIETIDKLKSEDKAMQKRLDALEASPSRRLD